MDKTKELEKKANETKADCKRIDFLNIVWVRKE